MKKEHTGSLKRTNYESGIKRSMNEKYKIICIIPLSHMQQFLLLILSFPDIFLLWIVNWQNGTKRSRKIKIFMNIFTFESLIRAECEFAWCSSDIVQTAHCSYMLSLQASVLQSARTDTTQLDNK